MGGGSRGLETPALIDGDVDHHCAGLKICQHLSGDQFGRRRAGYEHSADDQIGFAGMLLRGLRRGVHRAELPPVLFI